MISRKRLAEILSESMADHDISEETISDVTLCFLERLDQEAPEVNFRFRPENDDYSDDDEDDIDIDDDDDSDDDFED